MHDALGMAALMWCVTASSLLVHRADRAAAEYDASDAADHLCVAAWLLNCLALTWQLEATHQLHVLPFYCLVAFFNYVRTWAGPYKSLPRRIFHVCMHTSGVLGTMYIVQKASAVT